MSDKSSHGVFFLDLLLFVDITNHFLWSDYTIAKHRLQVGIFIFISYNPKVSERKMTMVILSNNKTICAEYNRLTVQRNYGNGKDKKFALIGNVHHHSDVLNSYPTKEEAVAELEKIYGSGV